MTPPRRSAGRIVAAATALVVAASVATSGGAAHAGDLVFRKKSKAPATDTTGSEASPSGGDEGAGAGGDAETPPAKTEYVPQAEDRDRPRDPDLLAKNRADAALAKKRKREAEEPAFYQKTPFWVITGSAVLAVVLAIIFVPKIVHEINGGDVRACDPHFSGCFP